jgi:outer membrane murein-binding lipoprotein Lpp
MQIFAQLVEKADDHTDLVELARVNIRNQKNTLHSTVSQLCAQIKQIEKRRNRLKYTGTERNFLADLLEQRVSALAAKADGLEEEMKVGDRALEILRQFAYEAEELPAIQDYGQFFSRIHGMPTR